MCVLAPRRAAANNAVAAFGWGPDFFSIPLYNPTGGQIKEYAADVVLTAEMLLLLEALPANILLPPDIMIPVTAAKGQARLKEIATVRGVQLRP